MTEQNEPRSQLADFLTIILMVIVGLLVFVGIPSAVIFLSEGTRTPTVIYTATSTSTNTLAPANTDTPTNTLIPIYTLTATSPPSPTPADTPMATFTPFPTITDTPTLPIPTDTPGPTSTFTPSPEPTATFTPTPEPPTSTPTYTPTPTATRVLTIELLEPKSDAKYDGVNQILFSWKFIDASASLTADEYFALRVWHCDRPEESHSIVWRKDFNYILDLYNKTLGIDFSEGYYYWNVGVVCELCKPHDKPGCWEAHYESEPRLIYINKAEPLTPIPSPLPTHTLVPTQPPEPTNGPP